MQSEQTINPLKILHEPSDLSGFIICIHPGSLEIQRYQQLINSFPSWAIYVLELQQLPFYQINSLSVQSEYLLSTEQLGQMVSIKFDDMVKSNKPVVLLGWSLGGIIAQMFSTQWPNKNQIILLIILDSIVLSPPKIFNGNNLIFQKIMLRWFVNWINSKKNITLKLPIFYLFLTEKNCIFQLYQQALKLNILEESVLYNDFYNLFRTYSFGVFRNYKFRANLQLKPYFGQAILFRASKNFLNRFFFLKDLGWKRYAKKLIVHQLAANHYSLITAQRNMHAIALCMAEQIKEFYKN